MAGLLCVRPPVFLSCAVWLRALSGAIFRCTESVPTILAPRAPCLSSSVRIRPPLGQERACPTIGVSRLGLLVDTSPIRCCHWHEESAVPCPCRHHYSQAQRIRSSTRHGHSPKLSPPKLQSGVFVISPVSLAGTRHSPISPFHKPSLDLSLSDE